MPNPEKVRGKGMKQLIFLDTETTGIEVLKDRLCQICYKTSEGFFTEYFKPPVPMSIKSMSITNITNKMLQDKKPFKGSAMSKDLQKLLSGEILVSHNAKFDIAMLEAEGLTIPRSICTLRIARYLDPNNVIPEYNLPFLRYYYELEVTDAPAHDAEGDVKVLCAVFDKLFLKMKEEVGGSAVVKTMADKDDEVINKMVEISSKPSLYKIFPFGKYKDKKIEEVVKSDRRYMEWMLNQKMTDGGQDEDWIYTLEYYLKN